MVLCYQITNNKINIVNDVFKNNRISTKYYLESIKNFYQYLTGVNLTVSIYLCDNIPALSISESKKIIFQTALISLKDVAMYLYFPHEVFHQIIGNEVKFIGAGKIWMLESLTEYLQLLYIKHINKSLYLKQLLYYLERYKKTAAHDIPILSIDNNSTELNIKATIESRGVLIFLIYFNKIEEQKIRQFLKRMISIKNFTLSIFLELCKKIGVDSKKLFEEISSTDNFRSLENKINEVIIYEIDI